MDDLVERMAKHAEYHSDSKDILREAAAEIARLREELAARPPQPSPPPRRW